MTLLDIEPRNGTAKRTPRVSRRRLATHPAELARRALAEREQLLRQMITTHGEAVLAKCMRVTRDRHDAEDAAQQTFIALSKRLAENELRGPIDKPQAWLTRVAKRCAIDVVRARTSRRSHESAAANHRSNGHVAATDSRDASNTVDARLAVQEVLGTLPANYKTPMVLFYFGGQTLEGIAKQLGLTANAVGVKLHRGRSMLAKRLKARGIVMPAALLSALLAEVIRKQVSTSVASSTTASAGGGATLLVGTTLLAGKARWVAIGGLVLGTASTIGAQSGRIVDAGREALQRVRDAISGVELPKPSLSLPVVPRPIASNDPATPAAPESILKDLPGCASAPQYAVTPARPSTTPYPFAASKPYVVVRGSTIPIGPTVTSSNATSSPLATHAPGRAIGATSTSLASRNSPTGFSGSGSSGASRGTDDPAPVLPGTPIAYASSGLAVDAAVNGIAGPSFDSTGGESSVVVNTRTTNAADGTLSFAGNGSGRAYYTGPGIATDGVSIDSETSATIGQPRPTEYPALDGTMIPVDTEFNYSPLWPGLEYRSFRVQSHSLDGISVHGAVPEPASLVVIVVAGATMLSRRRR